MATVYGVNAAKIASTPPQNAGVGEQGGVVKLIYDKYTFVADQADGDLLYMGGLIPKGARVIDVMVKFGDMGAGSSGVIDVGWLISADGLQAADDDGFMASVDIDAADIIKMSDNLTGATAAGMGKKFLGACQPVIKLTTDVSLLVDIELFILYSEA